MDADGLTLPPNREGEIVIYTPQLSSGYLNNESLTADTFMQHPHDPTRKVYRTGDLGWLAEDGLLYVAGRKDFQVKLRGMNVNMQEVSTALQMHPQVQEAAVAAHTDAQGSKRLVGYVVSGDSPPTVAALREFLGRSLAPFKIPSYFIFLGALPKLPNGKVDYRGLPAPDGQRPVLSTDYAAPGSRLEQNLVAIWEETLGLRRLGVNDDFHELGGDSLQAASIFVEIEKRLKKSLPPAVLYSAPTVRALAQRLEQDVVSRVGEDGLWLVPIQRGKRGRPFLFFVTPVRGDAMAYQHIIRNLSPDLTIYGLNTWTLSARQQKKTTLPELAARCLKLVLSADPEGPYVLGGHSFAGILSYEIARQLRQTGKEVKFIWMGDTYGPGTSGAPRGKRGRLRREVAALMPGARLQFILNRLLHPARYLKRLRTGLARRFRWSFLMPHSLEIGGTGFKGKYIPSKQDIRVVMFLASGRRPIPGDDGSMGWNKVVSSGVEVMAVSGSHMSMLHDRGAEEIAAGLMAALNSGRDLQ